MIPVERLATEEYDNLLSEDVVQELVDFNQSRQNYNTVDYRNTLNNYNKVLSKAYENLITNVNEVNRCNTRRYIDSMDYSN